MQKPCPICKVLVTPGLDGGCPKCGVALDDAPESVDLDTMAATLDAACPSCGGLLMGATDQCPVCGLPLAGAAPVPVSTFPEETFVPPPELSDPGFGDQTFLPPPQDGVPEAGDTFVPPLESLITPHDPTAATMVSAPEMPVETFVEAPSFLQPIPIEGAPEEEMAAETRVQTLPAPLADDAPIALPDIDPAPAPATSPSTPVANTAALGAPAPATAEEAELWDGLPVSWEQRGGEREAPPATPPAPAPPAFEMPAPDPDPAPEPPPSPLPVARALTAPPWQTAAPAPAKPEVLELATPKKTKQKTSWEQRWDRAEAPAGSVKVPRGPVPTRAFAGLLLVIGFAAAAAVAADQYGLLPGRENLAATTGTPIDGAATVEPSAVAATSPEPRATAPPLETRNATPSIAAATKAPRPTVVAIAPTPAPTTTLAATPTPRTTATATPRPITPTPVVAAATPTPRPATPTPTPRPATPTPAPTVVALAPTPPPATPVATSAAATTSDDRAATIKRSQSLIKQGKVDDAVRELKRLVKEDDAFAEGHYHLGTAYAYQGEFAKACGELKRYLKMSPNGPYAANAKASLANCP